MERELTPQLPGIVNGVAYEDCMGGPSVDIVDDESDLEEAMDKHVDSEHVYIIPASHCSIDMLRVAPEMHEALKKCLDALYNETHGKTDSYWIKTVKEMSSKVLAKAIGQ